MASAGRVFELGRHAVELLNVDLKLCSRPPGSAPQPPKPLLVASPAEEGDYPLLIFLHGYMLLNSFYSQLFRHVASHGFVVVGPQLYLVSGADCTDEIKSAAAVADWLSDGLRQVLPAHVRPDLTRVSLAGHSRGGKVAFALALGGHAKTALKISALMGIDPVDGMAPDSQTPPPVLTHVPRSFDLAMAVMVVGSGLGGVRRNPLFPPCAPVGVSHQAFFDECQPPACHFVAKDYGHADMLDDETRGVRGMATYCTCKNGEARRPMRTFVGGIMVAFMKAYLEGDDSFLMGVREHPEVAPVELDVAFLE